METDNNGFITAPRRASNKPSTLNELLADQPLFMSLQQIEATGLASVKHLRNAIARGELPAGKVGKRRPGIQKDTRPIKVAKANLIAWWEPIGGAR